MDRNGNNPTKSEEGDCVLRNTFFSSHSARFSMSIAEIKRKAVVLAVLQSTTK